MKDAIVNTYDFRELVSRAGGFVPVYPAVGGGIPVTGPAGGYDFASLSGDDFDAIASNALGRPMIFPLELQIENEDWWRLPFEPIITVTGKNVIVKKAVSKGSVRGSIKERWCQDDYNINLEGVLINVEQDAYPKEDVMRLKRHCEAAKLKVRCPLFELFSINQIVVETFDFPATTGLRNQAYKISACSDDIYKLLLRQEDLKQL